MPTIKNLQREYFSKIPPLDLDILISRAIKKSREFVLAHPEYKLTPRQTLRAKYYMRQRVKKKPIAYIVGRKEFYGLDFKTNENVLIPRPETEQIVELAINNLQSVIRKNKKTVIIDVGAGSGNIIISIAKWLKKSKLRIANYQLLASDISPKALHVARQNAKIHNVDKKIKFLQGNLLKFLMDKEILFIDHCSLIIVANLPYLSKKVYNSAPADVKKYEPKSALYSPEQGLRHYKRLFKQIKKLTVADCPPRVNCYLEISSEQKSAIQKLAKRYFPSAKIKFSQDLDGKWRVCEINITLEKQTFV